MGGEVRFGHGRVEEAVGEDRAGRPGIRQPRDRLIGVLGAVVAVREVEDRGHPGIERLERADVVADVHVLGGEPRGERVSLIPTT